MMAPFLSRTKSTQQTSSQLLVPAETRCLWPDTYRASRLWIAPSPMNPRRCIYPPSVVVAGCLCGDASVLQRGFEYPAAVELIHRCAVDLLPRRLALGDHRDAFFPLAAFYLLVGD